MLRVCTALLLAVVVALPAAGQGHYDGALEPGDVAMGSGEFMDLYEVTVQQGQWVEVALRSSAFDPYVILRPPGCAGTGSRCDGQFDNDDFFADGGSFLWVEAPATGTWTVIATSFAPRTEGAYALDVVVHPDGSGPQTEGVTLDAVRTHWNALAEGNTALSTGEYVQRYPFAAQAGDRVTVDLLSDAFDPYLVLQMPNGIQLDNDDYEGDVRRARIEHTLPVSGVYTVLVTTYEAGETGAYVLTLEPRGQASETELLAQDPTRSDVIGQPEHGPEAPLRSGHDRALLFATDDYADPALRDLANPIADAEAIADELRAHYGFEVEVVRNPTRSEVYAALTRSAAALDGEDDQLLVFFAGHGTFMGEGKQGRGFLIPSDGRAGDRSSWLSYADLADELDLQPAQRVLLVLDVCFGGSFVEQSRDVSDPYQTASPSAIVQRYGRYRSRLALTSGAREYVSDGGPNVDGLLVFEEVVLYARDVDGPTPLSGGFGGNEPGSTFFFGAHDLR